MIKRIRKFKERSVLAKECIITLLAVGAGRLIMSMLIVLSVLGIPNSVGNSGSTSGKIHNHSERTMIISSLNSWTYIWLLFYVNLDGANRRSGKVLLFVSKKINKGAGFDFADMKEYPKKMNGYKFEFDSISGLAAINMFNYKHIVILSEFSSETETIDNYFQRDLYGYSQDYTPVTEGRMVSHSSSHPQSAIPGEIEGFISPAQVQEVSKLVSGMSSEQIIARLKQDNAFKQQIKAATGADIWKSMQANRAAYKK